LHFVHRISIPNTLRKSSDHRIYLDRRLGLSCSPGADLRFRVEARFEPYDPPRTLAFQTAIGGSDAAISPGRVAFDLEGQNLSLEATREPGEDALSFVFGDLTNSNETYGGGRFLDASLADGGKVILDFNKAYNPPCVFTPYATCPLPTHENKLPVRIEAGERSSAMH